MQTLQFLINTNTLDNVVRKQLGGVIIKTKIKQCLAYLKFQFIK